MEYWLARVVVKLNASFLNSTVLSNWIPDQEDPEAESRALDALEIARIIKSPGGFVGAPPQYQYRIYDLQSGTKRSAPTRRIVDFDYDKFLHFCAVNGLNPIASGILAKLKIVDDIEPVVNIGDNDYALKSLSAGSATQRIVAYAYKNLGTEISTDTLRTNVKLRQLQDEKLNLNQVFKKNLFGEQGLLSAFADISKKSLLLKGQTLLTPDQVAEIKRVGTKRGSK